MVDWIGSVAIGGAAVAVVGLLAWLLRRWLQGGQFRKDDVKIDGKVVIITGANSGIGRETALDLAKRGARICLACRSIQKAGLVRQEIINKSGNQNIYAKQLDLSSFESIRKFVTEQVTLIFVHIVQ